MQAVTPEKSRKSSVQIRDMHRVSRDAENRQVELCLGDELSRAQFHRGSSRHYSSAKGVLLQYVRTARTRLVVDLQFCGNSVCKSFLSTCSSFWRALI